MDGNAGVSESGINKCREEPERERKHLGRKDEEKTLHCTVQNVQLDIKGFYNGRVKHYG